MTGDSKTTPTKPDTTGPTVEIKDSRGRLVVPNEEYGPMVDTATTLPPGVRIIDDPVEIIEVKKQYNKKKKKAKRKKQKQSRRKNRC